LGCRRPRARHPQRGQLARRGSAPAESRLGRFTLVYAGLPGGPLHALLHLASHVGSGSLAVTALSALILSLTRLIRAIGPPAVRMYRARLRAGFARSAMDDLRDGKVVAADAATVINALARLEAAAGGRDHTGNDTEAERPARDGTAAPPRRARRSAALGDVTGSPGPTGGNGSDPSSDRN
jgi:hypothetical protein